MGARADVCVLAAQSDNSGWLPALPQAAFRSTAERGAQAAKSRRGQHRVHPPVHRCLPPGSAAAALTSQAYILSTRMPTSS